MSTGYAKKIGMDVSATDEKTGELLYVPGINNLGLRYNQHWGVLRRDRYNPGAPEEGLAERVNVYHKPQFSLKDFWNVNDNFSISNIVYLSLGYGGGDGPFSSSLPYIEDPEDPHYGQINWQRIYDNNAKAIPDSFRSLLPNQQTIQR